MYCARISDFSALLNRTNAIFPHICRSIQRKSANTVSDGSKFSTIYRFEHIMPCSALNKFKKYQLALVGAGTPTVFALNACGLVDESIVQAFAGLGFASTVAIFGIGQIFTNLVGFVYLSKDRSQLKFSYLNFWGYRLDKIVPLEDVVGITPESLVPWDCLNIANDRTSYKITLRHGEILSTPLFRMALKQS